MPQGPRPSGGAGSSEAPIRGSSARDPENAGSRQRRLPERRRYPCQTRIDTNPCLLILAPGLLWPGFRKAPPDGRGPLRRRRGVARRADLTCINLGLTGTKAAYGKKSPKSENGAATLASRPGSAERGASGPGAFPAGGEGAAPPLPISVIFCHGRRVACAEPPSAGAGPGRRALRRPG